MRKNVGALTTLGGILILCLLSTRALACEEANKNLGKVKFRFPPETTNCFHFEVNQSAKNLRGNLTPSEVAQIQDDRSVWNALKIPDSTVNPKPSDISLYPASGVDFGLPIQVTPGAGLYIGVDIEKGLSSQEITEMAKNKDPKKVEKLFSEATYIKTIPFMMTGSAGQGRKFGTAFLKNLVTQLPDDAVILSVDFILDRQPYLNPNQVPPKLKEVGPHTLVTWEHNGVKQSALLISAPMPSPSGGKGIWWYDQLAALKPAYAVMKRPQGFSFEETFTEMCKWVSERGGMIISEGSTEDATKDSMVKECLDKTNYSSHLVSNSKLKREGPIFGFDQVAQVVQVLGKKSSVGSPLSPKSPSGSTSGS